MTPDPALHNPDNIAALEVVIERAVRFEELDPMGVMWHGRYASWFEDGREAFGRRYGISYRDLYANGCLAPIKRFNVDYCRPLRHDAVYRIHTRLLWSEAARMNFQYAIRDAKGTVMTRASTVQLFTDPGGVLLLDHPDFYKRFLAAWKNGELR